VNSVYFYISLLFMLPDQGNLMFLV